MKSHVKSYQNGMLKNFLAIFCQEILSKLSVIPDKLCQFLSKNLSIFFKAAFY
jgi:hypothetical protein